MPLCQGTFCTLADRWARLSSATSNLNRTCQQYLPRRFRKRTASWPSCQRPNANAWISTSSRSRWRWVRSFTSPAAGWSTFTSYIVQVALGDLPHGSIGYQTIFAAGLTLILITLVFNILGQWLRAKFRENY